MSAALPTTRVEARTGATPMRFSNGTAVRGNTFRTTTVNGVQK